MPVNMSVGVNSCQDTRALLAESEEIHRCTESIVDGYMKEYWTHEEKSLGMVKISEAEETPTPPLSVKGEEERILQAIRDYEAQAKPKYKIGINMEERHTMKDVEEFLTAEINKYEKRDEKPGIWAKLRRVFQELGRHGELAEEWLGLLPTDSHYLSVVAGGIIFILHAAILLKDIQQDILGTLYEIPACLAGAQRVMGIFKSSPTLRRQSDALYTATLMALGSIFEYIRTKTWKKIVKAVFMQSEYAKDLRKKLDDIKKCRDAFNEQATICGMEVQGEMQIIMQQTDANTKVVHEEFKKLAEVFELSSREQSRAQQFLQESTTAILEDTKAIREDIHAMRLENQEQDNIGKQLYAMFMSCGLLRMEAISRVLPFDDDSLSVSSFLNLAMLPSTSESKPKGYSHKTIRNMVLTQLDYDSKRLQVDVDANYNLADTLPPNDQDRCVYAMNAHELAVWIKTPSSAVLIVNGNFPLAQRRSPLTFLSARLAHSLDLLRESAPEIKAQLAAIHFFCGEHTDRQDSMNSAISIVQNLLAQLLLSFKHIDLMPLLKMGHFDNKNDPKALRDRFEFTLNLLPTTATVFCIIENLPYFLLDEKTSHDTNSLLRWLIRLTHRHGTKAGVCIFKLLLTAPVRFSESEMHRLKDTEILHIPGVVPQTGGFTDGKWDTGTGSWVEELAQE